MGVKWLYDFVLRVLLHGSTEVKHSKGIIRLHDMPSDYLSNCLNSCFRNSIN